jgi:hypothetical protein
MFFRLLIHNKSNSLQSRCPLIIIFVWTVISTLMFEEQLLNISYVIDFQRSIKSCNWHNMVCIMRIVVGPCLKFRVILMLQPNFTFYFEILRWPTSPIFKGSDYLVYLVYKKDKRFKGLRLHECYNLISSFILQFWGDLPSFSKLLIVMVCLIFPVHMILPLHS